MCFYTMTVFQALTDVVFEDLFLEENLINCKDCIQNITSSNQKDKDRFYN